jgi:hypothetical protein
MFLVATLTSNGYNIRDKSNTNLDSFPKTLSTPRKVTPSLNLNSHVFSIGVLVF